MKKKILISLAVLGLLILSFGVVGCDKKEKNDVPPPPINQEDELVTMEITLYFGDEQAMYLLPEKRLVDVAEDISDEDMITVIVEELIAGPTNADLQPTIPAEAKLLKVKLDNDIAYIDFNEEMRSKHGGGSAGETMTITSLVNSVTELGKVNKVQLLIAGKIPETLSGHWDTSEPIGRNLDIIKK